MARHVSGDLEFVHGFDYAGAGFRGLDVDDSSFYIQEIDPTMDSNARDFALHLNFRQQPAQCRGPFGPYILPPASHPLPQALADFLPREILRCSRWFTHASRNNANTPSVGDVARLHLLGKVFAESGMDGFAQSHVPGRRVRNF